MISTFQEEYHSIKVYIFGLTTSTIRYKHFYRSFFNKQALKIEKTANKMF